MAAIHLRENPAAASDLALLFDLPVAVLVLNERGLLTAWNPPAENLIGCAECAGLAMPDLLARCGIEGRVPLAVSDDVPIASSLRLTDGRMLKVLMRPRAGGGFVLTLEDVSGYVREAELAQSDPLTGLANRVALRSTLTEMLRHKVRGTLFCFDLDRFKAVNDTLGHPIGDSLLRKVADRMRSLLREPDLAVRLGGDEFAILCPGISQAEEAEALAARIVDLLGRAYVIDGHMINVSASVGVAISPADGADADPLLKNADLALYRAKSDGKNRFRFFEAEMDERMQARRAMEIDLRRALAFREFQLVYQPQVQLESDRVVGFEALLRWHCSARGLVGPDDFIPLAEEIGLMSEIGAWVLRTACDEASRWSEPLSIAVNLSPVQFRDSGLVGMVMGTLAHTGLDPARLELEITEGALLEDTDAVLHVLNRLRDLGVRISMDDFGTGYSSLSYLQKFPFDKIKIDQSFVRGMSANADSAAIVRAVASLGASLGMRTTAEGVETLEQLAAIRAEGCHEVQGYLTGRPMSASEAALLIASKGSKKEG